MRRYSLARVSSLLITRAAFSGPAGTKVLNLLVDTGSTYTIAAVEAVEAIGCNPVGSKEHVRIVTGSGHAVAPLVKIPHLQCLGYKIRGFKIVPGRKTPAYDMTVTHRVFDAQ